MPQSAVAIQSYVASKYRVIVKKWVEMGWNNVPFVWLLRFCPVEKLAGLADGPAGCGAGARGGCPFAWNSQYDKLNCKFVLITNLMHNSFIL
jgi:hypothetical protein